MIEDSYQHRCVKIRYTDLTKVEVSFRPPKLSDAQVLRFVVELTASEKTKVKYFDVTHVKESYMWEFPKLLPNTEYKFEIFAAYAENNGQAINGRIKTQSEGRHYSVIKWPGVYVKNKYNKL